MNTLSFRIISSSESNDHQVRLLIDNKDFLGNDFLGIDPPRFFNQNAFLRGKLLIGRCTCGVEGCGDLIVNVQTKENVVIWTNNNTLNLQFVKSDYLVEIEKSKNDFSWEDLNRRVERLATFFFIDTQTIDGFTFDWISCRCENKKISIAYSRKSLDYKQEIFEFDWDGKTEDDALEKADKFLETNNRIKK